MSTSSDPIPMGEGDHFPAGARHRKADPAKARKIAQGAAQADVIRKEAELHHEAIDVPAAEEGLEQAWKQMEGGSTLSEAKTQIKKQA